MLRVYMQKLWMASPRFWEVLLLVIVVAALYGQFLSNPLQYDDRYFFLLDRSGNMPISTFQYSLFQLRSLPYATLAWTRDLFGPDLIYLRMGNLLLHVAVVITLYSFLKILFSTVKADLFGDAVTPHRAAFFSSLLFAVHPVATYAAGYLIQRSIVMATLFALLAMLAYVYGSIHNKKLWLWAAVPFFYVSVFSKEHAIMLPAALVALTMLLHADWYAKLKERWIIFFSLALIALSVLFIQKGLLGSVYEVAAPEMLQGVEAKYVYPLSVITQSWLFFKYVLLWCFPNPAWMSVDMREPFAPSLFSAYLLALAAFVAWGAGALWLLLRRGRLGFVGFALLFPWLMFFTEFATVRVQEEFVLYRSYLWAVGGFCLWPVIFSRISIQRASLVSLLIALAMFPISMERLMIFSHPVLLWDDAEKLVKGHLDLPGVDLIYYNRGTEWLKIDRPDEAIADLKQAIVLSENFGEAYANLGAAYAKKQDWQNAIPAYNKAINIFIQKPQWKYFYGRAVAFEGGGNIEKAQADYKIACLLANQGCDKLPNGRLDLQKSQDVQEIAPTNSSSAVPPQSP